MNGLELLPDYENPRTGEAECFALPIDSTTYFDLFTHTEQPRIETSLDRHGLVDKTALAQVVLETAPIGHYWGKNKRDHHWQWPDSLYPDLPAAEVNPHTFRGLSINKEKIPLSFERRLHIVTLHPPVPDDEVMAQRIESYQAANTLFDTARDIIQWQRRVRRQRMFNATDEYARRMNNKPENEKRDRRYNRHVGKDFARGFRMHLQRYYDIPPEFRLVEVAGGAEQVAIDLGRALGERALKQARVAA